MGRAREGSITALRPCLASSVDVPNAERPGALPRSGSPGQPYSAVEASDLYRTNNPRSNNRAKLLITSPASRPQ
jgi:hypothetical protein